MAFLQVTVIFLLGTSAYGVTLNEVLGAQNLFPEELNGIGGAIGVDVVGQLKKLVNNETTLTQVYSNYKTKFAKETSHGSQKAFVKTLFKIARHNLEFRAGSSSWEMGVNQFTDLTPDELARRTSALKIDNSTFLPPADDASRPMVTGAANVDWRANNIVGASKDQQNCGSCVTFATAAIVESACAKSRKILYDLSEQELLDCTPDNQGCNGGWYTQSLYQVQTSGLPLEKTYPYQQKQGTCQRSGKARAVKSSDIRTAKSCNSGGYPNILQDAVAGWGPIAVAVGVTNDWYVYKSGWYDKPCAGTVNHALVVVGYTSEGWIIKNSWGSRWGEKGFIKLKYGVANCKVADHCFYVEC